MAADGYFKDRDAAALRDHAALQREQAVKEMGWKNEDRAAHQALANERQAVARSGLELQNKQNTNALENFDAKAELERQDLANKAEMQPYAHRSELSKARNNATLAEAAEEMTPQKIDALRRQGVMDENTAFTTAMAGLQNHLLSDQTGASAVQYLNQLLPTFSSTKGRPPIARVTGGTPPGATEQHLMAMDSSGNVVFALSQSQMKAMAESVKGGAKFEKIDAGDTLVKIVNGVATPVYTAPESEKSKATKQGPLERDVAYLESAHGMSKAQALAHLNSAKTMSREQFILKSVQDMQALNKNPTDQDVESFGRLYDSVSTNTAQSRATTNKGPSLQSVTPPSTTSTRSADWSQWAN